MDVEFQPRRPGSVVPLTARQSQAWQHMVRSGTPLSARSCCFGVRILGPLNREALERGIEAVISRHESLRTRIVSVDGVPRQEFDSSGRFELSRVDVSAISPTNREAELLRLADEFLREKVDIAVGPLFSARLLEASDTEHVLMLALHHIVMDGASREILISEIWSSYNDTVHGRSLAPARMPAQYGDYAIWQKINKAAWFENNAAYWKDRLSGVPRIEIPTDAVAATGERPVGATLNISLSDTLAVALRELARRERTMLSLVVLSVYAIVMSRWCGQNDLVIGCPFNGRDYSWMQGMIGWLSFPLHLRIEVSGRDSFVDLLRRVKAEFYTAYERHDFGWAIDIVPECPRELFFNSIPTWSVQDLRKEGDTCELSSFPYRFAHPIKFMPLLSAAGAGLDLTVLYRPDLMACSTIERFGRNMQLCAETFVRDPRARLMSFEYSG